MSTKPKKSTQDLINDRFNEIEQGIQVRFDIIDKKLEGVLLTLDRLQTLEEEEGESVPIKVPTIDNLN